MTTKKSIPEVQPAVEETVQEVQPAVEESTILENEPAQEEVVPEGETTEEVVPEEAEVPEEKPKISKYEVVVPFHDIDNFAKEFKVGQTVTGIKEGRLSSLLQRGYVKEV